MTHYKTNSRTDTEYWRANAANRNISEPLKQLLNLWMSGNGIAPAGPQAGSGQAAIRCFPGIPSWRAWEFFPIRRMLHPPRGRGESLSESPKSTTCSSAALPIIGIIAKCSAAFRRAATATPCRFTFGDMRPSAIPGLDADGHSARCAAGQAARGVAWIGARLARRARSSRLAGSPGALPQAASTAAQPVDALMTAPEIDGEIFYNDSHERL